MAIILKINAADKSNNVVWKSLNINKKLSRLVDTAKFTVRKYGSISYTPTVGDDIEIKEGTDVIFAGEVLNWDERVETSKGVVFDINCVDWLYKFDSETVSEAYESQTIQQIIDHIIANYTSGGFTSNNVDGTFTIDKIVFNNVYPSACLKRLADILGYDFYIDEDKDIHFFSKETNTAPYDLEDDSGNYVYKSLARKIDGSQIANRVIIGGGQYNASTYTDVITVSGADSKSFSLPYKFDNLTIRIDIGAGWVAQDIGIDNIDDYGASVDVLYNYQDKMIRFENVLADGDKIEFSGNPKVDVLAISEEPDSIAKYGVKTKYIEDKSIEDLDIARKRASAELATYAETVEDVKFKTLTSGLRVGQYINLKSTERDCDTDFIINDIVFKMIDPNTFDYTVSLITTRKYGLIELLQAILEPDPKQSDEQAVAQKIKADVKEITITELIEVTSAVTDIITLTIAEDIQDDPLGAGVEPTWVLGPYTPTSISDPKRVGLLDRSLKLY